METRINKGWAVICPTHGQVFLTEQEYDFQLSRPDRTWMCPCGESAQWDDDNHQDWLDKNEGQQE